MDNQPPPTSGIARFIPGLTLFKGVSSTLLRTEFVVAITLFAVLVPSAMAYGDLAGVTPVAGLYVALGAMVMYVLFGPSFHILLADPKQSKSQDVNIATQDNLR
jgi:SulP family sulfate permease